MIRMKINSEVLLWYSVQGTYSLLKWLYWAVPEKNLIQNTLKSSCSLFHFQAISNIAILVPLLFLKILALRYITYMRMCVLYLWWSLRHSLPSASDNFRKIGSHPPPACLSSPLTLKRTQKQKVL